MSSDKNEEEIQIKPYTRKDTKCENTGYILAISDNGIGIPESIDFENSETLGLQLINILIDQLDGDVELKKDQGTEFIISFSAEEKEN